MEAIRRSGCSDRMKAQLKKNAIVCEKIRVEAGDGESLLMYCNNGSQWYQEGIVVVSPSVVMEVNVGGMIEGDVSKRELLVVNGEDVSEIEHNQVLDLSDDGERWEGDVLNDQPCGWGVLYDKDGEKVYEGFRVGDVSVCYGIQYYSDIQKVEYEGMIFEGKRWGRGVQYGRDGSTMFDGEWMNNTRLEKSVVISAEHPFFHNRVEELIVGDECCNGEQWEEFDLCLFRSLKLFQVGDECFESVSDVKLIGLKELERVVIGCYSFCGRNCSLYLENCERLRELEIGDSSFVDHYECIPIDDLRRIYLYREKRSYKRVNYCACSVLELKRRCWRGNVMNRLAAAKNSRLLLVCVQRLLCCRV